MYIVNENETYNLNDAIENILENEMDDGQSLNAYAACEHFVELIHFRINQNLYKMTYKIDARDVLDVSLDASIIGYQFYDVDMAMLQIGDKQYNLRTGRKNMSPIIYRGHREVVNGKTVIVCNNGYICSNINDADVTEDELKCLNDVQASKVYSKKKNF